jgi:DNA-binding FrmR family transcriptional regulator
MADPVITCCSPPAADTTGEARHALVHDEALTDRTLTRLRRIEGQLRGLQAMVADHRWCPDILVQVASVQAALRGVERELLRHHVTHCVVQAVQDGDETARDAVIAELVALCTKSGR